MGCRVKLKIPRDLMTEIQSHVEASYPEEAVGLLLGKFNELERHVRTVLPLSNQFAPGQRERRYQIEAKEMLDAERLADQLGQQILGVFHSHPDHPARPSQFDVEMAVPWYFYLITTVREGRAEESRAWKLEQDHSRMSELTLELQQEAT